MFSFHFFGLKFNIANFLERKNYSANYHYFYYLNGVNLFGDHCDLRLFSILVALCNIYCEYYRSRVFTRGSTRDIVLNVKPKGKNQERACNQNKDSCNMRVRWH